MKEILFRGMALNGKFVEGNLSILKQDFDCIKAGCYISNKAGASFAYDVHPETIGQYIGLKDKNGKRIFEGDIIVVVDLSAVEFFKESEVMKQEFMTRTYEVIWDKMRWAIRFLPSSKYGYNILPPYPIFPFPLEHVEIEVIGNIHENPELLIGEK